MEKEKIRLDDSERMVEIELNESGDSIVISAESATLFDRFVSGYKSIYDLADSIQSKVKEVEKKYEGKEDFSSQIEKTVEISRINVDFSKGAVRIIDSIFGEGTIGKYFKAMYDKMPDFVPDAYCIIEFFEKIVPVVERVFDRHIERRNSEHMARMAKYKPRDHKRTQKKSAQK